MPLPDDHHPATSGGGVTLRLFVAMELAPEPAVALARYAGALAEGHDDLRPLASDALHLTWAFLGDVAEEHVPAVARSLEVASSTVPGPTACSVAGVRAYGSGRVLGVEIDVELLTLLDAARDGFLRAVAPYAHGLDQRAWLPHVSVARARGRRTLPAALVDGPPQPPAATWIAPGLALYASLPAPDGRQHRRVHAFDFGAAVARG